MMEHILLIEDDQEVLSFNKILLTDNGYKVHAATTAEEGLDIVRKNPPDCIISDIQLPGLSGIKFCEILKSEARTSSIPIILLTVLGKEKDKVTGLKIGADDYLTKPFSAKELLARVEALLRRVKYAGAPVESYKFRDLMVDVNKREVTLKGKPIFLRRKEYELLLLFIKKKGQVLTREVITRAIWQDDVIVTGNTLNVLVNSLRQKLGSHKDLITTIVGEGYKLDENFKLS